MSDLEGPVLAWHWLRANRRLGYEDGREVVDGETLSALDVRRTPKCCYYGMHASERVVDALCFAPGCVLTRVEISGEISRQPDKLVGRNRKVLWSLTIKQGLDLVVAFAQWCASREKQHNANAYADAYANAATYADAYAANAATYAAAAAANAANAAANAANAANADANAATYAANAAANAANAAANAERDLQEHWLLTEIANLHGSAL